MNIDKPTNGVRADAGHEDDVEGLKAFKCKVDIGQSYEDAAIRDHLVLGAEGKGR